MKTLRFIFFVTLLSSQAAQAAVIGASNIAGQSVVVGVQDDESPERVLVRLNLKTSAKEKITLPTQISDEDIMGLVLFPEQLVMISQWTAGGGKNPKVFEYDFKQKKWSAGKEFACLSFDTVLVKASEMKVECEEGAAQKVSLGFKAASAVKAVFPFKSGKNSAVSYKLSGGTLFRWKSIDFQEGKKGKKTLNTVELLKGL